MNFAANLKAARIRAGLTQEQLALACGWSGQSRIANYESSADSSREPKVSEVPLLAKALGVSVAELFGDTSQSQRLDFDKIAGAVAVLSSYLEVAGHPAHWISDAALLETAYMVAEEFGAPVAPDNILDITKALSKRIRGTNDTSEGSIRGAGKAASR